MEFQLIGWSAGQRDKQKEETPKFVLCMCFC